MGTLCGVDNEPSELDFKEPPRVVSVPFTKLHDFCALLTLRNNAVLTMIVKNGFYRVSLQHPLQDDMLHFTIEEK